MNHSIVIFLGLLITMATSWYGLIGTTVRQLGSEQQASIGPMNTRYPVPPVGDATLGAQVYRELGCAYCHSQQIRQTGTVFSLVLDKVGDRPEVVTEAIGNVRPKAAQLMIRKWMDQAPSTVLEGVDWPTLTRAKKKLDDAGATTAFLVQPMGSDFDRGWGGRRSVSLDHLYSQAPQLGNLRIGPDLANIGNRQPDASWHFVHLYSPRSVVEKSTMPGYPFLFKKQLIGDKSSPDALKLEGESVPESGYEVVPTSKARALVAYLQSLRLDMPVFEAPSRLELAAPVAEESAAAPEAK